MNDQLSKLIEDIVNYTFELAQENVDKDCNNTKVVPVAFCISDIAANGYPIPKDDDTVIMLPWEDDEQQTEMLRMVGDKCYKNNKSKVIIILDAAMKEFNHEPDFVTDQPLTYPENMRVECFVLFYIDFLDAEENFFRVFPYKRVGDKVIRIEDNSSRNSRVVFNNPVPGFICFGFLKAGIVDEYVKRNIIDNQFNKDVGDTLLRAVLEKYPGATLGYNIEDTVVE